MTNIMFIESGDSGGGSFESLYQFLKVLDRDKYSPVVVFLNSTRFVKLIEHLGIKVYLFKDLIYTRRSPLIIHKVFGRLAFEISRQLKKISVTALYFLHYPLIRDLVETARQKNIHLIYLNGQVNRDLFGVYAAQKLNIPCICHLRSMDGKSFNRQKAEFANKYVHQYISNSKATKTYWDKQGISSGKNTIIYNAIPPLEDVTLSIRKKFSIDERFDYIIGCAGRLISIKGHDFLFRAFKKLLKSKPSSVLLIMGDGPLRGELEQYARHLNIGNNVFFTGYLEKARQYMHELDLLVFPSRYDAFGRVIIEAMEQGVPVIGSNLYGILEIIEHTKNGMLVTYDDDEALSNYMDMILSDKELADRLIQKGYSSVREKFSIEQFREKLETTLDKVIKKAFESGFQG